MLWTVGRWVVACLEEESVRRICVLSRMDVLCSVLVGLGVSIGGVRGIG